MTETAVEIGCVDSWVHEDAASRKEQPGVYTEINDAAGQRTTSKMPRHFGASKNLSEAPHDTSPKDFGDVSCGDREDAHQGPNCQHALASALFDPKVDSRFQPRIISPGSAGVELERISFDETHRTEAEKKFHHIIIKAMELSAPGANILKQSCLSLGADAAVHKGAIDCSIGREALLITATEAQFEKLIPKIEQQPFGLKPLAESIKRMSERQRTLGKGPVEVMAILNVTPDSFSDGGSLDSTDSVVAKAGEALDMGADILDVGGESTRPGAVTVSPEEELRRVIPAIKALSRTFPGARISIDTRKAEVAKAALDMGASIVNDVSGLTFDPAMKRLVAEEGCQVVIMHSQGEPQTMQVNPYYKDIIGEISAFFYNTVAEAVDAGVKPSKIILDPGFGFGKNLEHNLELMKRLSELVSIGFPLLVGTSRKSFLTLGQSHITPDKREALTAASLALAVQAGARIVRIHDVKTEMPVVQWLLKVFTYTE